MTFSTAIPEKPNVMYIWVAMDELIEKFSEKISKIQPDSQKDATAFDEIILAMNELKNYSLEMQKLLWWWPPHMLRKAEIGKDAGLVFKKHFGEDRLPPLAGVKSMTYNRDIILPFMRYIADIDSEGWLVSLCEKVGVNFKDQIKIANDVADGIKNKIEDYNCSRQQEITASTKHTRRVSVTFSGYFAAEIVEEENFGQEDKKENRAVL